MEHELSVQDQIVFKLMNRFVKSKEIQDILNENLNLEFDHDKTRRYMRDLEKKLSKEGIMIESSTKGYYIPKNVDEAVEGLKFIRKQAIGLLRRYNQRLELYKKYFPEIDQLELDLKFDEVKNES